MASAAAENDPFATGRVPAVDNAPSVDGVSEDIQLLEDQINGLMSSLTGDPEHDGELYRKAHELLSSSLDSASRQASI